MYFLVLHIPVCTCCAALNASLYGEGAKCENFAVKCYTLRTSSTSIFFLSFLNQVASAVAASMGCTNGTGIACDGRCIYSMKTGIGLLQALAVAAAIDAVI